MSAMIDEADGVIEDAHIMPFSRTGRHQKNGASEFLQHEPKQGIAGGSGCREDFGIEIRP
jgi:hypothetical protein